MSAKKLAKTLKEIEETTVLVDYLLFQGFDFDNLCACLQRNCQVCISYDQSFFSEKRVREAKEWTRGNVY